MNRLGILKILNNVPKVKIFGTAMNITSKNKREIVHYFNERIHLADPNVSIMEFIDNFVDT
jgi:hypothetical protein